MFQYSTTQLVRTQSELPLNMFKRFFQKNRKLAWGLFAAILLFVAIVPVPAGAEDLSFSGFLSGAVDLAATPIKPVLQLLLMIPMNFAAWLLWLSGVFLNSVLGFTVVNLTQNINATTGINSAWAVIRDLSNMSFIFILLYAAIKTILGDGGSIKNVVVGTVIAAVLINFSLFFAKVIIDISNVVALTFYNQILPAGGLIRANGLADSIMQPLGVTTIFSPIDSAAQLLKSLTQSLSTIVIVSVGSSIFMYVTAGIFFAIAGMFITRYVSIIFLLVLSPVAILGTFLPQFKSYGNAWWNRLTSEALFAPVFMIMMWVALTIINSYSFMCPGTQSTLAQLFSGIMTSVSDGTTGTSCSGSATGLLMNFVIAISFVSATLVVARKTANHAGSVAQEIAGKLTSPFTGAAGWAGRQTMGRGAAALVNSKWLNTAASQKFDGRPGSTFRGIAGIAGRAGVQQAQGVAKSNFDPAAALGFAASANKSGYGDRKKADEKERQEAASRVQSLQNEKDIMAGLKAKEAARLAGTAIAPGSPEQLLVDKMEKAFAQSSGKQIETIVNGNKDLLKSLDFASSISVQTLDHLNKSDAYSEEEKRELNDTRFADILTAIRSGAPLSQDIKNKIRGLGDSELEFIAPDMTQNPAHVQRFTEPMRRSQVDAIMKSTKFVSSQKSNTRKGRADSVWATITAGIPGTATAPAIPAWASVTKIDPKDLAELDSVKLEDPSLLPYYTTKQLKRLGEAITDDAKSASLRRALLTPGVGTNPAVVNWLGTPEGQAAL